MGSGIAESVAGYTSTPQEGPMVSRMMLPSLVGIASVLVGCTPECRAVTHAGTATDTVTVAATGKVCEVHVYAQTLDSVGPKPRQ